MSNRVLCVALLYTTIAGSVFSHTIPLSHEKPGWEQPVVISEEYFPPHPPSHHQPHNLPHNEFKEIIGIELQRIPFHGDPEHEILEHERHKEHHKHELLEHELPSPDLLHHEHEHEHQHHHQHQHHSHHLEHEHEEHAHREHEIRVHEHPHDDDILEHEHHEHDVAAHQIPHPLNHPPWEDPDFVLSEEEHEHEEHEHEFHHEELFPEVSRRRTNRRREGSSGGSRRNNSNSNRRGNSNSNRQGNNNRRENSNSRGNRGGSNVNTEELFSRRNRQNNNRRNNNNNNNRRNNNSRENSRRNSNIEELAALEEEIAHNPEVSSVEISRPERDVGSYINSDRGETSIYESSLPKQSESSFPTHGYSHTHSQPNDNIETKSYASESNAGRHSDRRFTNEQSFGESRQQRPPHSHYNNQEYSNSGFASNSNTNEYSTSISGTRRPDQTSSNIFVKEEEYLTLDGSTSQQSNSRPTGSNNGQSWGTQELAGSSRPGQSSGFGSSRPGEFASGGSSRPGYLGSRPGSGKPLLPTQESSRPNRPGSSSSGLYSQEEERPNRPSSGSSGLFSNQEERRPGSSSSGSFYQEERPNRPSGGSSGSHSHRPSSSSSASSFYQEERPNRPSSSSSGSSFFQEERPGRPSSSSSGSSFYQEERPNRPGGSSSGSSFYQEERPGRPSSSGSSFYQEERPGRPSSSGSHSHQEERPNRPNTGTSAHYTNQENSRPNRPSNSHSSSQGHSFHEDSSRPNRPSSRPNEEKENSRPRPTNGNNLYNATDLISVQEDPWSWPNLSEDEDKKNRRADSGGNKGSSGTTKRPSTSGGNNKKQKQHANLKLLPTDSCGVDLGNKIIGGENTQLDEFPWMALLQHSSADGRALGFGCGGSLISPRYVLTAAHCIKGPAIGQNIKVTKVRLGEFDISSDVDCQGEICSPPPVDIPVEEIIVHPKYRATDRAQMNDIALIRLRENAKTSGYISPICLPLNGKKDHVGEKLTVAGWGKTSNGQKGASSKTKQKVSIPVVSLEDCSPFYNRINIQLNNTQMCAGGERGKDSCQGDSGGPLMSSEVIDSQIRWQVHGIVSFGPEDCGIDNVAGVYTRVSEYIDWILDNMKK